jgi:hypothetical protein
MTFNEIIDYAIVWRLEILFPINWTEIKFFSYFFREKKIKNLQKLLLKVIKNFKKWAQILTQPERY